MCNLRLAQPNELAKALEFVQAYYAYDQIEADVVKVRAGLQELLGNSTHGHFWFVQDQNQPVGHVVLTYGFDLEFGGRNATVTELFLQASHRGRGFGHAIFEFLDQHCADLGIDAIELQVERENLQAQSFYQQLGFRAHDRIPLSRQVLRRGAT